MEGSRWHKPPVLIQETVEPGRGVGIVHSLSRRRLSCHRIPVLQDGRGRRHVSFGEAAPLVFLALCDYVAAVMRACLRRVMISLLLSVATGGQTGPGTWQELAPMPAARQELATAVLNGKIYVLAGYDENGNDGLRLVYDPPTNTWASAQPLPSVNNHNNAAVAACKLYSFGGRSNTTFLYDPINNSWTPVATLNLGRGDTAAEASSTTGSMCRRRPRGNALEVFNPATNTWTILAPMSVAAIIAAAASSTASSMSWADAVRQVRRRLSKLTTRRPTLGAFARRCRRGVRALGLERSTANFMFLAVRFPLCIRRSKFIIRAAIPGEACQICRRRGTAFGPQSSVIKFTFRAVAESRDSARRTTTTSSSSPARRPLLIFPHA